MSKLNIYISNNKRSVKINNIEHLLHDTDVNILWYNENYTIINTEHGDIGIIKKLANNSNYIILINKLIDKYIFNNQEIEYLYLCAIHRYTKIINISINEKYAEINIEKLLIPSYYIFIERQPDENSIYEYAFKKKYPFINDDVNKTASLYEYNIILYGFRYNLCINFIKCIEQLCLKNSSSIYISSDKKCKFINNNVPGDYLSNGPILCSLVQSNKFISHINALDIINVNVPLPYLSSVKNQDWPNIGINKEPACINIISEYLRSDFFTYLLPYENCSFDICIYYISPEHSYNIISELKNKSIIKRPLINSGLIFRYTKKDAGIIMPITEPILFRIMPPC